MTLYIWIAESADWGVSYGIYPTEKLRDEGWNLWLQQEFNITAKQLEASKHPYDMVGDYRWFLETYNMSDAI